MSRTGRLLEIMITLNSTHRFTVNQLAEQFSVSRRTMLRDLQLLSEMGVPLAATPGPHGGYTVMREQQLPPISLSPSEAVALILSYEALDKYPDGPFAKENLETLTKLRSILPSNVIEEVDLYRERMTVEAPPRNYKAPFLRDMLHASIDRVHMEIEYESRSGQSTRIVFPYGIVASNGFWYCPSYCYTREEAAYFRADRIKRASRLENYTQIPPVEKLSLNELLQHEDSRIKNTIPFKATFTKDGVKIADSLPIIGALLQVQEDGTGKIDTGIPVNDVTWYARLLLSVGKEVIVEEPKPMIDFIGNEASKMAINYAELGGDI